MANGDDGYGQVGGNGSVEWTFDFKNKKFATSVDVGPHGHRQSGADLNGDPGDNFTISLEVPEDSPGQEAFLKRLNGGWEADGKRRVKFELKIEKRNPDQIRISWPKSKYRPKAS